MDVTNLNVAPETIPESASLISYSDGSAKFYFRLAMVPNTGLSSIIMIWATVIERIKSEGADIGITYMKIPGAPRLNFYIDGI